MGHLFRCLNIAKALKIDFGISSRFFVSGENDAIKPLLNTEFETRFHPDRDSINQLFLENIEASGIAVVDLPTPTSELLNQIEKQGYHVFFISDDEKPSTFPGSTISASIPGSDSSSNAYRNFHDYCGLDYMVIDPAFAEASRIRTDRNFNETVASFGGSDPIGMTLRFVRSLNRLNLKTETNIILGPSNKDEDKIRKLITNNSTNARLTINPPNLAKEFANADFAFLAGGITAFEAAANGLPSILLPTAEHENRRAKNLTELGCAFSVPSAWRVPPRQLEGSLNKILSNLYSNNEYIIQKSLKGPEMIDGQGSHRIAKIIKDRMLLP